MYEMGGRKGWQKDRPVEREVSIADLAAEFLARESGSAETGKGVVVVPTPHGSSGDPGSARGLKSWSAAGKSAPMKGEAAVAILASEGLAQVAVSCQHARRSFVPLICFVYIQLSFVLTLFIFKAPNYVLARTLTERVV